MPFKTALREDHAGHTGHAVLLWPTQCYDSTTIA
jgi:hypothetical protein